MELLKFEAMSSGCSRSKCKEQLQHCEGMSESASCSDTGYYRGNRKLPMVSQRVAARDASNQWTLKSGPRARSDPRMDPIRSARFPDECLVL